MFDRELLAVYAIIRHFRHNLEGRYFFVNTNHKPLTFVMTSVTERPSLRQSRQLAFIAEFTTDKKYVKRETNFVADALSRLTVSFIEKSFNHKLYRIRRRSSLGHRIYVVATFKVVYHEFSITQII